RNLLERDIVVCDAQKPVAVAGVMGGENSEVKDDTQNIVIEVAFFNPIQVRKTARRLGMHTEASHRLERGVDIERVHDVARRVAALRYSCAAELGLAVTLIGGYILDAYPGPVSRKHIALRLARAREILAIPQLSFKKIEGCLAPLALQMIDSNDERMVF